MHLLFSDDHAFFDRAHQFSSSWLDSRVARQSTRCLRDIVTGPLALRSNRPDLGVRCHSPQRWYHSPSCPPEFTNDGLHAHIAHNDSSFCEQGVPGKGRVLTQISLFWFNKLKDVIPTHFVTADIDQMSPEVRQYKEQLQGRAMLVRKAKVVPLEAIVRGYITGKNFALIVTFYSGSSCNCDGSMYTGSAWSEYKKSSTVHGIPLPPGLVESQKFPEPLFTPSTKAEQGQHDENISPQQGNKSAAR